METAIIILFSVLIGLTFGWLFLLRDTVRKHDKHLLEMEWEFKHLKAVVNTNDKFVDKTFDGLVDCTERIDALGKRINSIKHTLETSSHYDGYRPIYCDGSTCINPYCDCNNCPRWVIKEGNKTISDRTEFKDE